MKKAAVMIIAFVSILLTGCNRAIPADEAGELLIDRLIYQEKKNEFEAGFRDGEATGKKLDDNSLDFEENFISGLESTGTKVPKEEAEKLTQELLKQTKAKTSYRIVEIKENKKGAEITYFITGLDLVNAMKEMTRTLVREAVEKADGAETDQEILESTISILTERIKVIKIENDDIEISLKLEKEGGKWYIPAAQEETVSRIFMAFISGTEDDEELNDGLNEAVDEVMNEMLDSLYSQPALDEETTDEELQQAIDDLLKETQGSTEESATTESD
ncbi:DUF5105 domain-containing protein [Enterococcus sp. LJL128]|uniref:DUF5105 domain-containing protein n=1 Tax=Enterococcus sp. LJL51 TaxID=3416656 RepID=UPI003CE7FB70